VTTPPAELALDLHYMAKALRELLFFFDHGYDRDFNAPGARELMLALVELVDAAQAFGRWQNGPTITVRAAEAEGVLVGEGRP